MSDCRMGDDMWFGQSGSGLIHNVPTVCELVDQIMADAEKLIRANHAALSLAG